MKKTLALIMSLTLAASAFAGCTSNKQEQTPASSAPAASEAASQAASEPAAAEGGVKTGFAVISSIQNSKDAAEQDGLAQMDSTIAAVIVDADGKILDCVIDQTQTKVNFSNQGKITTDLNTVFKTKAELGAEYGMAKASAIGKEWNEQAAAFSDYVVGKTVEEVKGIAVTAEGKPSAEDLAASVTVSIGDFTAAVEKAVNNAQAMGANAGDTLGLGVITNIKKSKDAGEEDGLAQAYSYYTASTFGADGKITSCIIDGSQTNVNFSKEGKITSDLKAEHKTKNELGADYGMAKASSIGKEWNEQAKALADYVTGKTVEEVKGVSVNEKGAPADAELSASVTISIGDYIAVIEKAAMSAK